MVPNVEANAVFCARLTTGWRASSVARSWYPTSLGSANNIMTPSQREVRRPPSGLLRDATISRLAPPLQNAANPPVAKRRRDGANATDFPYWSINLAKLLIRRRIATISPRAAIAAASRAFGRGRRDRSDGSGPDQNSRADEPDTIG